MQNDVFMALRNDKERAAFLDNYRDDCNGYWYLAKMLSEYGRRFFAYYGNGYTVFVEDELQTVTWPKKGQKWLSRAFYLVTDEDSKKGKPFADCRKSKTEIINWVKDKRKNWGGNA